MMPFVAVDQDRVGEAELADRAGDQRHLRLAVGAGVAGVGDQRRDRAVVDRERLGGFDLAQADGHPPSHCVDPSRPCCGLRAILCRTRAPRQYVAPGQSASSSVILITAQDM